MAEAVANLHANLRRRGAKLHVALGAAAAAFRALEQVASVVAVHAHGPELCSEEQRVERAVAGVVGSQREREHGAGGLRRYWAWTLHHVDDLPHGMQRGRATPERYKPFLQVRVCPSVRLSSRTQPWVLTTRRALFVRYTPHQHRALRAL